MCVCDMTPACPELFYYTEPYYSMCPHLNTWMSIIVTSWLETDILSKSLLPTSMHILYLRQNEHCSSGFWSFIFQQHISPWKQNYMTLHNILFIALKRVINISDFVWTIIVLGSSYCWCFVWSILQPTQKDISSLTHGLTIPWNTASHDIVQIM